MDEGEGREEKRNETKREREGRESGGARGPRANRQVDRYVHNERSGNRMKRGWDGMEWNGPVVQSSRSRRRGLSRSKREGKNGEGKRMRGRERAIQ